MSFPKNIVIILGHPDSRSFCGELARIYHDTAADVGHHVRRFMLGEVPFDPVLRHGYAQRQELEPGLVEIREAITWADHLVFVYPIWWGAMPALLKGFVDRVFLPGFAFKYRTDSIFWDKLLSGKSAHVITTMDTPPVYFRWIYRMPGHHQIKKTILEFSGVNPVKVLSLGPIRGSSDAQREKWKSRVIKCASRC